MLYEIKYGLLFYPYSMFGKLLEKLLAQQIGFYQLQHYVGFNSWRQFFHVITYTVPFYGEGSWNVPQREDYILWEMGGSVWFREVFVSLWFSLSIVSSDEKLGTEMPDKVEPC